ncbi:MAG: fumarylacetoacetate hydrolase family protein [Bacteroidales bacterium]|jgi:2-keto-4-pentenoate hydratase/2-oxohepta-3-ene-1,7-dioic acid hydratase in catechol pathway|nr:fumarylacetoacetate hydrolase family protein [Bacteroidales bacterium]
MKIIGIGMNYAAHIAELKRPAPAKTAELKHSAHIEHKSCETNSTPVFFLKPETALLTRNRPFYIPDFSTHIDYEAEVVVKICRVGKNIAERFSHRYYEELTVGIDFTARDLQNEARRKGNPWAACKGFDHSAAVGIFVNKSELPPVNALHLRLDKNGATMQNALTAEMLFGIDALISHVSKYMTLHIGDLIFTGTPQGVGKVATGDKLEVFLEDKRLLYCNVK